MRAKNSLVNLVAALLVVCGCSEPENGARLEERSESNYERGLAEYTAGRIDQASAAFFDAVKANPANASARFQLGVLLQEHRKDYLAALCCYREYLNLAAHSDKAGIARERMEACEKLLLAEMAKKNSLVDSSGLLKEVQRMSSGIEALYKQRIMLAESLAAAEKKAGALEREKNALSAMIKRMGDCSEESVPARPVTVARKDSAQEEPAPVKKEPPRKIASAEDAAEKPLSLNPDAKALFEAEEREARTGSSVLPEQKAVKTSTEEKKDSPVPALPDAFYKPKKESAEKGAPAKPEYYVVQQGDTLRAIAKKFYGDKKEWVRIREANKARVSTTGEIKAGDRIRLP